MLTPSRRRSPVVAPVLGALALELVIRALDDGADLAIVRADFGATGIVVATVAIVNFLGGLFRGRVDANTKYALEGMRTGIRDLAADLLVGLAWAGGWIERILSALKGFLMRVFAPLFRTLAGLYDRIVRILDRIFGPILQFLDEIRDWLRRFYTKWIRPILDAIEAVRAALRILSAFGVEWVKTLDAKLAELEEWVMLPYEKIMGLINRISDTINRIVTLDGLFQRLPLLRSIFRDVQFINSLWWNSQTLRRFGVPPRPIPQAPAHVEPAAIVAEMQEHFRTGNAPISPAIRESAANVRLIIRRAA